MKLEQRVSSNKMKSARCWFQPERERARGCDIPIVCRDKNIPKNCLVARLAIQVSVNLKSQLDRLDFFPPLRLFSLITPLIPGGSFDSTVYREFNEGSVILYRVYF